MDKKNPDLKKPHYYGKEDDVHLFHALDDEHKALVGVHVTDPDNQKLSEAISEAKKRGMKSVVIHGTPPEKFRAKTGEFMKSENLSKSEQYWVGFDKAPSKKDSKYDKWEMSKEELKQHIDNWDKKATWHFSHDNKKKDSEEGVHSTAIARNGKISSPIKHHMSLPENANSQGKKILYHGVGQDYASAEALSNGGKYKGGNKVEGGKNEVHIYDKFHSNPEIKKKFPKNHFDEVHSHYTFNVVNSATGKDIMQQMHDSLKPGGRAIISVRRDKDMKRPDQEVRQTRTQRLKKADEDLESINSLKEIQEKLLDLKGKIASLLHPEDLKDLDPRFQEKENTPDENGEVKQEVSTRELISGMLKPEKECPACERPVERCLCFMGMPKPRIEIEPNKVTIFFKSENWDTESQEAFIDDFKRRAGRLLNKKFS